jgi:protein TonB
MSPAHGDRFIDAMLEMPTEQGKGRSPLKMAASVAIHAGILAALLILPVYYARNTLVLQKLTPTYVFTPAPPAPPPPAAAAAPKTQPVTQPKVIMPTPMVTPQIVPKHVAEDNSAAPPQVADAVAGGVPGGVPGGVLGGVLGGTGSLAPPAPPKSAVVRVGGDVKAPQLLKQTKPDYPPVARTAHVEGTVVIDAVIDKNGNVVSEHAVSGPGLLVSSALDAVKQWKYQPTYLNGQPVDLAMQVTVDFQLG